MPKVSFMIGATASGKTHFIEHFFVDKDVDVLNIFDYQQKAYKEAGFGKMMPMGGQFRCLMKANDIDYLKIHKKAGDKLIVWTCQSGAVLYQM